MGKFGKGKVGYSVFYLSGMPEDWQDRMESRGLPSLETLVEEEIHGWCGWRHAQDRTYTDESLRRGSYPTGLLVMAERKIPTSTLAADVALEELAVMKAEDKTYLNQQMRSEIKQQVRERLLPDMPITFKGTEWVYYPNEQLLFSTATTDKQIDTFVLMWTQTMGSSPRLLDAETRGALKGHILGEWAPVMFGDQGELFCDGAGREFLMWLWYGSEKRGGIIDVPDHGEFAYMLDGPLELRADGKKVTIKSGNAMIDTETKASLEDGLTLGRGKFMLVRGEEVWNCTLDADDMVIRGMKLPQTETFDVHGKFSERLVLMAVFEAALSHLFQCYCEERSKASNWKNMVRSINEWIAERPCRRPAAGNEPPNQHNGASGDGLGELLKAANMAEQLKQRRTDLRRLIKNYDESVEPYIQALETYMTMHCRKNAIKTAIHMAKALQEEHASDVAVQLQLVAALHVLESKKDEQAVPVDPVDEELVDQAKEVIRQTGRASTSSLQRRLRIGYTRAARIMDLLEERGVVGPPNGNGPREVLVEV